MVAAAIRQVFAAADRERGRANLADVVDRLERVAPKVARLLEDAEEELLAFLRFPREHWPQAALDEPARARQPRDRPPLRRRRHLPQRRRPDPPRRRAADRAERRVAGHPPLPLPGIDSTHLDANDALSVRPADDIIKMTKEHEVAALAPA